MSGALSSGRGMLTGVRGLGDLAGGGDFLDNQPGLYSSRRAVAGIRGQDGVGQVDGVTNLEGVEPARQLMSSHG